MKALFHIDNQTSAKPALHRLWMAAMVLLLVLPSCEKNFNISGSGYAPHMVVNSWLDNLDVFHVFITETSNITGSTTVNALTNARVELYKNDSLLTVLQYMPADSANVFGTYASTLFPIPGNRYSLKIYQSTYGLVTTMDSFPVLVQAQQYSLDSISNSSAGSNVYFTLQFHDNGATKDYYRLKTWITGTRWVFNSPSDSMLQNYALGSPPQILSALSDTVRDDDLLFSDANFNSTDKQIKFWFTIPDTIHFEQLNIAVQLHHASYAQYEYQSTLALARATNANNPTAVYSNISNGYGIFMSSAIYSMTVPVK